jgi:putative membrane protein
VLLIRVGASPLAYDFLKGNAAYIRLRLGPHGSEPMPYPLVVLGLVLAGELLLGIAPKADRITWFMENAPVFVLLPLAVLLQPKLKLTNFTLTVIAMHALVLMIGGHYTYAKVPLGFWVQDAFDLGRNHYDRFGHIMQGFGPAVAVRELLIKTSPLRRGFLLALTVVSMCLAFSALYEMMEWWSALLLGEGANAFLGTQGDAMGHVPGSRRRVGGRPACRTFPGPGSSA